MQQEVTKAWKPQNIVDEKLGKKTLCLHLAYDKLLFAVYMTDYYKHIWE